MGWRNVVRYVTEERGMTNPRMVYRHDKRGNRRLAQNPELEPRQRGALARELARPDRKQADQ